MVFTILEKLNLLNHFLEYFCGDGVGVASVVFACIHMEARSISSLSNKTEIIMVYNGGEKI